MYLINEIKYVVCKKLYKLAIIINNNFLIKINKIIKHIKNYKI